MTVPAFVGATRRIVTSGPVAVDVPAGVDAADLLLASIVTTQGSQVDTPPAGWTLLTGYPIASHTDGARQYVYERIATDPEPADYTWSQTGASRMGGIIVAYDTAIRVSGAIINEAARVASPSSDPPVPTGSLTQQADTRWVALLGIFGGLLSDLAVHSAQTRRAHLVDSPLAIAAGDDVPTADGHRDGQATGSLGLGFAAWDRVGTLLAIQHANLPPLAPDLDDVATFDATTAKTLTYRFRDPNVGDTQSARRIEIVHADGTPAVDTGKVATASESYDLAASTLTNEQRWQWRAKTWDQDDVEGPWSDWETFRTSVPPTVAITAPTQDQVVTDRSLLVEVDYSHPQHSQGWRRLELLDGGVVVRDTGKQPSGQTSHLLTDLNSDRSYTVRWTSWSTLDQPSTPDTADFTTDFPSPPVPSVSVESVDSNRLRVHIQNPPPGADQVAPDFNDLLRRTAATALSPAGEWVRIATGVAMQGIVDDWQVTHDVEVEYRAVARNAEFGDATGVAVAATLDLVGTWLHDVADPAGTATRVRGANQRGHRITDDHGLTRYHGRRRPVVEWGEGGDEQVTVNVTLPADPAAVATLVELLRSKATLCYRDKAGRVVFAASPAVDISDHLIGGGDVSVVLHAVDYTEEV